MRNLLGLLLILVFAIPALAQDAPFDKAASDISRQLVGKDKSLYAVSFFTNSQGYGPHYSDYLAEALSGALKKQGLHLATRNHIAQITAEKDLAAHEQFDAKFAHQVGSLKLADAVFGGTYQVKENEVTVDVHLLDVTTGEDLAFEQIMISRTRDVDSELNFTPVRRLNDVATDIGLDELEHGNYTTEENDRLIAMIEAAKTIKVLCVNCDNLFQKLKVSFQKFLSRPTSRMEVLLGNPNSDFYREETEMTKLPAKPGDPSYIANQGKVEFNRSRLIGLASDPEQQLQFKYFNTQYRMPLIIIDDTYCNLTLRLSPNESEQSIRLEFHGGKLDFADSCLVHFQRMWAVSNATPEKKIPE